MEFKSLDELEKYLLKQISVCLKSEVFEEVRDTMQEHIQSDIYDTYTPTMYNRRGANGGLIDDDNIIGEMENENTLYVSNITAPSPSVLGSTHSSQMGNRRSSQLGKTGGSLFEWVNEGKVPNIFNNRNNYPWMKARKAAIQAVAELEHGKRHVTALKNGLKRKGIDAE